MLRTNFTSQRTFVRLRVQFVRSALFFFCHRASAKCTERIKQRKNRNKQPGNRLWKFVMQRISIKNALCCEQTSPLGRRNKRCIIRSKLKFTAHSLRCFSFSQKPLVFGSPVFLYAFGFSLSVLRYFSFATGLQQNAQNALKGCIKIRFNFDTALFVPVFNYPTT